MTVPIQRTRRSSHPDQWRYWVLVRHACHAPVMSIRTTPTGPMDPSPPVRNDDRLTSGRDELFCGCRKWLPRTAHPGSALAELEARNWCSIRLSAERTPRCVLHTGAAAGGRQWWDRLLTMSAPYGCLNGSRSRLVRAISWRRGRWIGSTRRTSTLRPALSPIGSADRPIEVGGTAIRGHEFATHLPTG